MIRLAKAALASAALLASGLTTAQSATFSGEFWDVSGVSGLAAAESVIASRGPDATFISTAIDYPNGAQDDISDANSLATFLGADAASLTSTDPAVTDASIAARGLTGSIFRFTGFLDIAAGDSIFQLGSDDGFRLTVDGTSIMSSGNRAFGFSSTTLPLSGVLPFELVFFENGGNTGVEFFIDGALAVAADDPNAVVPLPATLPLLLAGIGGLALMRRR